VKNGDGHCENRDCEHEAEDDPDFHWSAVFRLKSSPRNQRNQAGKPSERNIAPTGDFRR
jgi:hypothetical protein